MVILFDVDCWENLEKINYHFTFENNMGAVAQRALNSN